MGYSLRDQLDPLVRQTAQAYGIDPEFMSRLHTQESGNYDSDVVSGQRVSSAGALGVGQFMPETARGFGINPLDPYQAIDASARYIQGMLQRYGGDYALAAAAYNAGPGNVDAALQQGGQSWYNFLPQETQQYVPILLGQGAQGMVMPGMTGGIGSAVDAEITSTLQMMAQLREQMQSPNLTAIQKSQIAEQYKVYADSLNSLKAAKAAEGNSSITPYQAGQLGISQGQLALGQAQLGATVSNQNAQNQIAYIQNQIAAGRLTYDQGMAELQKWLSAENAAEGEAKYLTDNQFKAAENAPRPGQEYYDGMEPGGPTAYFARMAGMSYDPNQYRLATTTVDPEGNLAAARQRFGINGPPPAMPGRTQVAMTPPTPYTPPAVGAGTGGGTGAPTSAQTQQAAAVNSAFDQGPYGNPTKTVMDAITKLKPSVPEGHQGWIGGSVPNPNAVSDPRDAQGSAMASVAPPPASEPVSTYRYVEPASIGNLVSQVGTPEARAVGEILNRLGIGKKKKKD